MFRKLLPLLLLGCWMSAPVAQDSTDSSLQRSGIVVIVKLEDAKGQPLVVTPNETASLFLWRECGARHRSSHAWYDWANSRVVCGGYGDRGIEPGEYVLEGSPGAYGPFMMRFTVGADTDRELAHKFSCWRRIVTFSLVDSAGKPVKEIESQPGYKYSWRQVTGYETKHLVSPLRQPPGQSRFNFGRGFSTDNRQPFSRQKYLTDEGKWHVGVIAGIPGTLWAGDEEWKETFEGDEWKELVEVEVTPADPKKKLPLGNPGDPGNRSAFGIIGKTITIKFEPGHDLHKPELSVPASWARSGRTWTASVPAGTTFEYRVSGGPLMSTSWLAAPKPQADGSFELTYSGKHAEIVLLASTPTMREWWDFGYANTPDFDALSTMYEPIGDNREFRTLLGDTQLSDVLSRGELKLVAGGGYSQEWAKTMRIHGGKPETRENQAIRLGSAGQTISATVKLDATQKATLKSTQVLKLTLPFTGIAFRGVTAEGGGLAEVYASIFPLADEKTALRLKEAETEHAAKDQRPNIVYLEKASAESLLAADKNTTDDELREWLGDGVYDALPDRDCRLRFGRFGAWYDTRSVLGSDQHGYVISDELELKMGVKYVMYVWGGSRDDLKPDGRVEFTYTGKGDDLGAIVLPDYE